jgi:hypothetical protein
MNLGVITPDDQSTTSLYRAIGPLSALRAHGVRLLSFPGWGWCELMQCDALFIHRPHHPMHRNIVRMARGLGVPVWLDFDDDLLNVPYWHPAAATCGEGFEDLLGHLFQMADVVSVSTPAIQESFCGRFANLGLTCDWQVIPNALDLRMWPTWDQAPLFEREKVVTWRSGPSNSHLRDLGEVLPAMGRVAKRFPDWRWVFMGGTHWDVVGALGAERVQIVPPQDFFGYAAALTNLRPSIHIVPLADSLFNRAKSNCAWLEATAAGAMVVGPVLPEWERPGMLQCTMPFEESLTVAIGAGAQWRADRRDESRAWIQRELMLDQVNDLRMEILKELTGNSQAPIADSREGRP